MPPSLLSLILDRIRERGPMTVAEYVDLALYQPALGYYARTGRRSGREGDFFTSVDLGPLFGELLAVQFAEMWRILAERPADRVDRAPRVPSPATAGTGRPAVFDLVEAGAGDGRLSRDVAAWASAYDTGFYAALRLHLVERSEAARRRQADVLGPHAGSLASSSPDLPPHVRGVIFANELLDALPPHLVVMREDGLREVYVDEAGGRLVTRESAPSSDRLSDHLEQVGARLEPGWFAEVNLAAFDWVKEAAAGLEAGFLLLIDYGHQAGELYSATHATGTLTAFRHHAAETRSAGAAWLNDPGECDITSHVDLSSVQRAARAGGLEPVVMVDQTYFLLGLGLASRLPDIEGASPRDLRRRLALKTLLLPGGLGSTHKVMIFGKGVGTPSLRGASFGGRLTR